ncbi:1,4-alpha-glucan branching protein GlgB [Paracoccus aurantiacus]|uniref:1,4-alpha-glucan branching enzyme GlgB n=1 Tax=Paracoccus aurantiacus TaxID=2599412 RepID=A0A5C6S990_9RHOB|nr:1,4-alpha-glucan branching protein GlgB [Paracoccus aurantiacus]TXB70944.1 1,4-alpha-glucan branching protein GlgB [Paracoccus aurantiacus]
MAEQQQDQDNPITQSPFELRLPPDRVRALIEGRDSDPFAVLGPHSVAGGWRVVAMDFGAREMSIATVEGVFPMQPVAGADGLFACFLPEPMPYLLRGTDGETEWEHEDPYRFGPVLGQIDEYLIGEGTHHQLWKALGAHVISHQGVRGTHFSVWAPNARRVAVLGDFNNWDARRHGMRRRGTTGVWEIFIPNIGNGSPYKFSITGAHGEPLPEKADPVGFGAEHPPATASVVRNLAGHKWSDDQWMQTRSEAQNIKAPISIYEVHLGSWRRVADDDNRPLSYLEHARDLIPYVKDMGFTHLELLPVSEFPFDGSWGYQPVGLYAPTIRFGTPEEFRSLVEAAHEAGIGVLLDWVPGHFPSDAHGLARFDGTALYEHADPREGFHQDWNTLIYNYGRREVSNYLTANALYWLQEYHVDGLRVDAVASMLYRDYSRKDGEWVPNIHGGRENLEAIEFLRGVNTVAYGEVPGIMTVAEESTAFPGVSRPVDAGGLGFGFKWNMGWMNDTLSYIQHEPVHRSHHHNQLTFGLVYAFSENFILPISHDEVVHGKGSMIEKMPGDVWQKFANLRAYYGFMWTHPGKKLLFMGCEFAQWKEWNHDASLDWHLLDDPRHKGVQSLIRDLNNLYRELPALHRRDNVPEGFSWIEGGAAQESILAYARYGEDGDAPVVAVCNFTPVPRHGWRVGLPRDGKWKLRLNSDAGVYGGSNMPTTPVTTADGDAWHGYDQSALIDLPPLSVLIYEAV